MLRPRIEELEVRGVSHQGRWSFGAGDVPVVISGPNGSGKTTLVETAMACMFGPGGQASGPPPAAAWSRVRVARGEARYDIRRDLTSGAVVVRSVADGEVVYEGTGDPGARTADGARYRSVLMDLLGIADGDAYSRTLFVRQGTLPLTRLGEELLKVAAGGHRRVESARRSIAESHRAVTSRPLHAVDRPAIEVGELERVEAEMARLAGRLEDARAADARRGPLALDRERLGERLARLAEEIDVLEESHAALTRGSVIEVSARQLKDLARRLEQTVAAVPAAAARLAAAEEDERTHTAGGLYPADLPERLAQAQLRWQDLERVSRKPPRWLAVVPLILLLAAAGLGVFVPAPWSRWAVGGVALAAVVATVVWGVLRLDALRTAARLRQELCQFLEGVPGGAELSPGVVERTEKRFLAQREARRRLVQARLGLAAALREARALLQSAGRSGVTVDPAGDPTGPERSDTGRAAARTTIRLRRVLDLTRERLIRERRELDRVGDASLRLPDGVVPSEEGVVAALRKRRDERRRVQETLQELEQELLERGTPAESLDALEAALAGLEPRREELLRKAEILESAHSLLTDAYDAFRARDQERLVGLVSEYGERLTGGTVGPVTVDGALESATVRVRGKSLAMASPPLSFGELHALFLAVRLGVARFLGGLGVFPPLILDDPFVHLDPAHAAAAWDMLCTVARERQVIITTQDELLLAALDVEPGIRLGLGLASAAGPSEQVPAA
jgi:recombinational DNA repair ATPase RecF